MPASYVHQCVAFETLSSSLEPGALLNAALAGAEGPDPLFFAITPLPGAPYPPHVGSQLHNQNTADFLLALLHACAGSELTRAFALGFFTHYATDTTFHPFVSAFAFTPKGVYSTNAHCLLEAQLETLHYRRTGHETGLPEQFAGYAALSRPQKDEIARAFSAAIASVFPGSALSPSRVASSFGSAVAFGRLLRSPGGTRYRLAGLFPFSDFARAHMMPPEPPARDIANDAHAPWASIWEPERTRRESFSDLFAASVARAKELTACASDAARGRVSQAALRDLTGDLSYGSGLPWRTTCPPEQAPGAASRRACASQRPS